MIQTETKVRVRYPEVDSMGYVHHSVYATYLEIGRTEMLRSWGMTYRQMESEGIMLPVISLSVNFLQPAIYDDLLTIQSRLKKKPGVRLEFLYTVTNESGDIVATGTSSHAFMSAKTRQPIRPPENFMKKVESFFS